MEAVVEGLADEENPGTGGGGVEGAGGRMGQGGEGAGLAWTLGLFHQRHGQVGCGAMV
jgi:hypothetical protein